MAFGKLGARGGFGSAGVLGGATYNPVTALGSDLIAWWDANRSDLITQSGGFVSSWKDIVAGYNQAQATGSAQPVYSASSFNGAPSISYDGIDDNTSCTDAALLAALPAGGNGCDMWLLAENSAPTSDVSTRLAFGYSGSGTQVGRNMGRNVVSGVNRTRSFVGDGTIANGFSGTVEDLSFRYVERMQVGASATNVITNGNADANQSVIPNTNSLLRARIGCSASSSAANFWQGKIAVAAITKPLSSDKAAALQSYLLSRRRL